MATILAVDGNSILNRAFYGVRPLTARNGMQTGAILGALNIILSQTERLSPDGVVVAFDLHGPTFRHEIYDKYKSNRHGMPDEMAQQLPYLKKIIRLLGYNIAEMQGYEGDDILGTVSRIAEKDGYDVCVLSGDKDLFQLISDKTKVLLIGNSETVEYGKNEFYDKYGIPVENFVELKALMGDNSDCIPGVPGIGEVTARKLISQFGTIDALYSDIDKLSCGSAIRNRIIGGKESAYLSKKLSEINREVPVAMTSAEMLISAPDKSALYDIFTELEFGSFIRRLNLAVTDDSTDIDYKKAPVEFLSTLKGDFCANFADDCLYLTNGSDFYKCNYSSFSELLGLFGKDINLCVFNSKKLYRKLFENGITDFNFCFDIMLAAYTVNPSESEFEFGKICLSYLGVEKKESHVDCVLKLKNILSEKIEKDGLHDIYYNIELPLSKLLANMEIGGFTIDREGIGKYSSLLDIRIAAEKEAVFAMTGIEFNINSPKQLSEVLFERLSLPAKKKVRGGYTTNAEALEKLRPYSPVIDEILEYRKLSKLQSTYTDGLLRVADENGIVHTEFKQTGTVTGRLSSSEPNLQNIPIKTEEGRELRKFFIPSGSGRYLIDADYSQIELRILAHLSQDENMISAFKNGDDIHSQTASRIFSVSPENVTDELRKKAKAINFGLIYGMSEYSLSQDVGISLVSAQAYVKSYFGAYPKIKEYLDSCVASALQYGYSQTIFGRRRYIPELSAGRASLRSFGERVAKNAPIQGSAADIIKLAMINTEKALKDAGLDARLILQVHDELIVDSSVADSEKAAEILKYEMENAVSLLVPLTVEMKIGKTWYDCK